MLHASRITSTAIVGFLGLGLAVGCSLVTDWDQVSLDAVGDGGGASGSKDGSKADPGTSGGSTSGDNVDPDRPIDDGSVPIDDDDAGDASVDGFDASACPVGQLRCASELGRKGIKLYKCNATGGADLAATCVRTCRVLTDTLPSRCDCIEPGLYCGGDQVVGDPQKLYRCQSDHTATLVKSCSSCVVSPGVDDVCNP